MLPLLTAAQELPREARLTALQAVVQVTAFDQERGIWTDLTGSGSIISPSGLVLTNYHVIGFNDERSNYPQAGIFQTDVDRPYAAPELRWWADYVAGDPNMDLALLRITANADGTPFQPEQGLASLELADSNLLLPGDLLTVVGYPGISGSTITFTQGIMSGWLGEDAEEGGQNWVKTDAKITRGNSGGAALNSRGQLVAVPTSGNHLMDEGDIYEEQLYARPLALAWPMLAAVADEVSWAPGQRPSPEAFAAAGEPWQPVTGEAVPAGNIGPLQPGQTVSGIIAGGAEGELVWHTYTLQVDQVPATVRVQASSVDDVDLAAGLNGPIPSYNGGDADFMDFTLENRPELVFDVLEPTLVHVDVVNAWGYPLAYDLVANIGPLERTADGYPAPIQQGHRGRLEPGITVSSNLELGAAGSTGWHTYVIEVPQHVSSVTFTLQPESVLGLAVKPGSDILGYDLPEDGGDTTAVQMDGAPGEPILLRVDSPQTGLWFIDVFNWAGRALDGRYQLTVDFKRVQRGN